MKLIFRSCFFIIILFATNSQATTLNNSFRECAKIDKDLTRLHCFDQLAKSFITPSENTDIQSIEVEKPPVLIQKENPVISSIQDNEKKQFIDNFGSSHLKKDTVNDEEKSMILTVAGVKKNTDKKLYFTFENGQTWKQMDNVRFKIKAGEKAKLKEGALGAVYLKKLGNNRSIRVKRVN
ncbi:hypothetical protein WNY51_10620 [Pseudocolwellia sp. AS88]|uniref:hypothetical protein n=1 Tax=Pseudocolwellia sp. AS88 TaxID=3063958 RepID=UPI0026EBC218|nr:hypothetical protein [Pseudocolwellia sp. AS88]MDO7085977.1 hypothetical protein [Pseudocolwellia sp. AS88]